MNSLTAEATPRKASGATSALARKLAEARRQLIEEYEHFHGMSREEAIALAHESDSTQITQQILGQPLQTTSWHDLDKLTAVDPDLAVERWNAMLDNSVEEMESGHRAARALESGSTQCHERAQFLAMREHLARDWQPRNGVEWSLIDAIATAQHMKFFWLQRMVAFDTLDLTEDIVSQLKLPRVTSAQAIEQAACMVDRFDRMFMRALRQLRDLRRYMPTVVVQHADQVNVGEQQLNVSSND